ncbi:hypothetical protein LMH87_005456 [Akanthomyces muscarius]|uniref:GPI anchored serine-rich protein n=1 Tax=Akanthomyces muscarius TaxID=2231603 RepID=A0A9W8US06_AKAMU|nr:hypothetical protein LMH87_005456 [Akanthomyces muscarius]KAJ4163748.1 hypothetical protein LMH87_005456 [Akanthomyces muscarius]
MLRLANLTALLAAIAPALAMSPLSNAQYTETIGAQEIGSTAIYGTMVYSMNHCSVIHSTQCYTSLSTGGPAPPSSTSIGYSSSYTPPLPSYGEPSETITSGGSVPVPTHSTVSSGGSGENPPQTTGTLIVHGSGSSSTTTHTPDVPTGAAAMGAAVMGNVFVAALAALAV